MPVPLGVVAAVGGMANMFAQSASNKASNKANMELAEYQYAKNLEQWHRENEYNLPSNQMQRLKDAGLNPNMVYGSGSVVGNTQSQSPQYQAPHVSKKINMPDMLSMYQNLEMNQAQIDNIKAQTRLTNQEVENRAIRGNIMSKELEKLGLDIDLLNSNLPHQKELKVQEVRKMRQTVRNLSHDEKLKILHQTNMEYKNEGEKLQNVIRKNQSELAKFGVYSSDNFLFRLAAKAAAEQNISIMDMVRKMDDVFLELFANPFKF